MDYIIFGLGAGATLTLVGWAFREWGPSIRDRSPAGAETVLSGYQLVDRMAWQRFCRSCGALLAIIGLLVLVTTIIATALMLSNRTGATIVLSTMAAGVVATLVWLGLFLHRFGARGIIRPKPATPLAESTTSRTPPAETAKAALVGPPVPDQGTGATAGDSTPSFDPAAGGDMGRDEADPEAEDPFVVDEAIDGSAEHSPPRDSADSSGRSDEPPSEGRLIVTAAANDEEVETSLVPDDTDSSPGASAHGILMEDVEIDAPGEGASTVSHSGSRIEPEVDEERAPDPEADPSSGRADAVRRLRERRVRRLKRDSSAPE